MSLLDSGGSRAVTLQVVESVADLTVSEVELRLDTALRILPGRREVYAGELIGLGRAVVAKRFLPHAKQARDSQQEWDGLTVLQDLKLSAPTPICIAKDSDAGAVWVIMECIENAASVEESFIAADASTRERMMHQLVHLVDEVHGKGVWQGDQHIANWAWDGARFYLLDAGTMHFQKEALDVAHRLIDLAGICVTLFPDAERLFRGSLAADYLSEDKAKQGQVLDGLDARIISLQRERTRRYYKKTRRNCTEFVRRESESTLCIHTRGADAVLIERFASDPDSFMQEGTCLKAGNTCTVQMFDFDGKGYVLKRYNQKSLFDRLRRAFSDSRALKSWSSSWVLEMAFIPTAQPVAVCEDRRQRLAGCRYLLMEQIKGQLLTEYVSAHAEETDELKAVAVAFAKLWASLGRIRAVHGDFKATNLMVGEDGVLYLIDLDAFRFNVSSAAFERGRTRDRNRFFKNWKNRPEVEQIFKQELEQLKEV